MKLLCLYVWSILLMQNVVESTSYLTEILDLTWPFDENTVNWPNTRKFQFTKRVATYTPEGNWYAMNEFCTAEHGGTHFDAPYHFYKNGWKVGDIPLLKLVGQGIVIDMTQETLIGGKNTSMEPKHIIEHENIYGIIPKDSIVLVKFGWSKFYPDKDEYLGLRNGKLHFPGISQAAASVLIEREVSGVGLDTPSVDLGISTTFNAHRTFAEKNIYILENVNIVHGLPATGFTLFVMPMKIRDGTGAPCRIIAVPLGPPEKHSRLPIASPLYVTTSATSLPWYAHSSVVLSSLLLLAMYSINCFTL